MLDLHQIHSFGFRGEALPSIAAVSRVKIWTRLHGAETGIEMVIEGGRQLSVKPQSCREGTVLEIRDLFFNTPARRKFLKTDLGFGPFVFRLPNGKHIVQAKNLGEMESIGTVAGIGG